ncbi:MAG: ABC transporter permease [bacterium]
MKIIDLIKEIYSAITVNKVRSGLTILGIMIGIGSVIGMIAIGQGSQNSIQSNIESLGSNLIMIMPGTQRGVGMQVSQGGGSSQTLKLSDGQAILDEVSLVKAIAPEASARYQITAKGTNTNTSVLGTTPDYLAVRSVKIDEGSFISSQNVKNSDKVAVIGPSARDDLFGENATGVVGATIKIKKINFKIIGVTEAKGGSGFTNQDDMVFAPISTVQKFLSGNDYLSTISAQVDKASDMTQAQEEITALLLLRHNIKDATLADFRVMNQADVVEGATSMMGTFTLLLGSIAGISLLVGGIGIMNMMLTTVTERTREIGLRKAIGAKRKDINIQFLLEALALTFIGGIIGVAFGWGISFAVSRFGNIATAISLSSVLLAFGVSAVIGIVFGFYPARRAGKLNPIEALRYE